MLTAEGDMIGNNAPFFKVSSGNGQILTLDMVKGKIIVIFYETKDAIEQNRQLKNELNQFYREQSNSVKEHLVRLPIINCSEAFWPFTGVWKKKLNENSTKEKIIIYGDWDGRMVTDFQFADKDSNVVIIDRNCKIRYAASGKINNLQTKEIKELLITLAE